MSAATVDKLREIPVFSSVDETGLKRIAGLATEFTAPRGHVLIERGQPGTGVFIIEEGSVRVDLPDGEQVEHRPGSFVGELAVLADTPRTARATVTEDLRGLAIARRDLMELLEREGSIAVTMLCEVARRLTETLQHPS